MKRFQLLAKAVSLGAVLLVLMVGLSMIGGLASERMGYRAQAAASVRESLAGPQTIAGAVATRRCTFTSEQIIEKDKVKTIERTDSTSVLKALPQSARWITSSKIEPRYRGLYKVNSFGLDANSRIEWTNLKALAVPQFKAPVVAVSCEDAQIEFAVSDPRGVRNVTLKAGSSALTVQPNNHQEVFRSGFAAVLPASLGALDAPLALELSMELVGLESLGFVPLAVENSVTLKSNWPHPSFLGAFLPNPNDRKATSAGFEVAWSVSSLASKSRTQLLKGAAMCDVRIASANDTCLQSFGVDFIDPINPASLSDRATKYGILFIVLTFAGIVLLEVLKGEAVHPVQYLLIGAAMAAFFLLLLSLSEHIAFVWAYVAAAVACVMLLTVYAKAALGGWKRALPMSAGLGVLYGVLYLVLQSEQHALLAGSLLVFAVLAGVMLMTRNVKWGRIHESA
ncbi:MAG: cell envelope integrity protein CreD [Casimicrobium sp.]